MKPSFSYQQILRSRIATFDTTSIGLSKHHVSALPEFDVINGAPMVRFLNDLTKSIESG